MNQRFHKYPILPLLSALLALAGCVKEVPSSDHEPGSLIQFGASTSWRNDGGTRTEYSGKDNNNLDINDNSTHERIDWVEGKDRIRILCEAAGGGPAADYTLRNVHVPEGAFQESAAGITPVSGKGLQWGFGEHYFYAMYPAPGMESNFAFTDNNPVTEAKAKIEAVTGNKAKISGTIPAVQEVIKTGNVYRPNMNYAYMFAATKTVANASGSVSLSFHPLVTTLEFTIKRLAADDIDKNLTRVELRSASTPLTGDFTATMNDAGVAEGDIVTPAYSEGINNLITITLPQESGESVPGVKLTDDLLTITFLTLPVTQKDLTLTLCFDADYATRRSIKLMDNDVPIEVPACHKAYFHNLGVPGTVWEYTLGHTGTTVTLSDGTVVQEVVRDEDSSGNTGTATFDSYRSSDGGATTEAVAVSLAYAEADDDGLPARTGGEIAWSSTRPSTLSSVTASGTASKTFSAKVTAYSTGVVKKVTNEFLKHVENLKSRVDVGSSFAPYDLSMYDIHGVSRNNKPVTANCYIVDRAGWYMFPVVYGNAIDHTKSANPLYDNGVNAYAYKDAASPAANESTKWHHFQNFTGTSLISSPYVLDDAGGLASTDVEAVVVWQDVKDATYSFIENVDIEEVPSTDSFFDPGTGSYKTSVPYIKFHVPAGSIDPDETKEVLERVTGIRQGNALIAIRLKEDKTIDGNPYPAETILWSWHIWITDGYDTDGDSKGDGFPSIPVTNRQDITLNMMPVNLGWCNTNVTTTYKDRVWYIRVSQNTGSAEPIIFRVVQKKAPASTGSSGTYYQWGRKDPFIPSKGLENTNKDAYSPDDYSLTSSTNALIFSDSPADNASTAIQNPYTHYYSLENTGWFASIGPNNLWNMAATSNDIAVSKTVYDPCPPGYCVPRRSAFSGFSTKDGITDNYSQFNVEDRNGDDAITRADFEKGWYFYTNSSKTETVFFPVTGFRTNNSSKMNYLPTHGYYWSAAPYLNEAFGLGFTSSGLSPKGYTRAIGAAVRPVQE